MALVQVECQGCDTDYFEFIRRYHSNDSAIIKFFQAHGVLPVEVTCPYCNLQCTYSELRHKFSCGRRRKIPKKGSRQCTYSVSLFKGTFLDNVHVKPWEVALFVNHWLQKFFDHVTIMRCLKWSARTSVDWRSFCSEVTQQWFANQRPIGGNGVIVEIDETLFVRRKYNRGRELSQVWLFGGIERLSKKKFVIPLNKDGQDRSAATLIPLIKQYILPDSVVISDGWAAYRTLSEEGYSHKVINHSEQFVDLDDHSIHTQNIERLWRDIKEWSKRPGNRKKYLDQYLARYLFINQLHKDEIQCHHHFFIEAGKLYPPHSDRQRPRAQTYSSSSSDSEDIDQPGPSGRPSF